MKSKADVGVCGVNKLTLVLGLVGVRVSNKGRLPVVMDVGVGDGDPVTSVCDIDQSIVVVFVVGDVRGDINVVNPDISCLVERDGIWRTVISMWF